MQFLYIDLVITTSLAVVMGRTGPSDQLVPQRPNGSLASAATVFPLLLQVGLTAGIQLAAFFLLLDQPW
jgi:magnesium-transporting ATPase (P-type)